MNIGILGTGRMAVRLADLLVANGHRVVFGSRSPQRARDIAAHFAAAGDVGAGTYLDAARQAIVLPAIFMRDGLLEVLAALRERLDGKLILDIANPFNADYSGFILPWTTSAAEQVQRRLPASTVVGLFKNVAWETFESPRFPEGHADVYVVGDDDAAKRLAVELFAPSPFRFLDAGHLRNARTVERMTLLAMELGARNGYLPRVGWKLLGEPWTPGVRDRWAPLLARAGRGAPAAA